MYIILEKKKKQQLKQLSRILRFAIRSNWWFAFRRKKKEEKKNLFNPYLVCVYRVTCDKYRRYRIVVSSSVIGGELYRKIERRNLSADRSSQRNAS